MAPIEKRKEASFHINPNLKKAVMLAWIVSISVVVHLSLKPHVVPHIDFHYADKLMHSLAYLWLAFLPFAGFTLTRNVLMASLMMIPLGVGLELAQTLIPDRVASISDVIANSLGVGIGVVCGFYFRRLYRYKAMETLYRTQRTWGKGR